MNDAQVKTAAELILPPVVVSRADVSRLVDEAERVDNAMTTASVREGIGATHDGAPTVSEQFAAFLEANGLQLNDGRVRTELIKQLHLLKDSVPVVHMTFAVTADPESLHELSQWMRNSVHPQAVLAVGLAPALVAGVYVRTSNRVKDLSLRGALAGSRGVLKKELEALRGRA